MKTIDAITPVILSGGGGTRLWPLSTPEKPKQLLSLAEDRTMLQVTALRVADKALYAPPLIIGSAAHADVIETQLREVGIEPGAIILEPAGRNTAPAIALAALSIDPEAVLLVMPSDHVIEKASAFQAAIKAGLPFAKSGWLVTFGISPTRAETGYGYIKLAEPLSEGVWRVERFVEKPVRATAEAMLAAGGHAWNGGIFLFRASNYLDALAVHAPELLIQVRRSMEASIRSGRRLSPERDSFIAAPSESIDYAVMEKAEKVAVVPVDLGWSDVGSWDALHELGPQDDAGNVVSGNAQLLDTSDCLVRGEGVRVSLLGVSDLIVVATKDEVLILPRGRSQEVKRLLGR